MIGFHRRIIPGCEQPEQVIRALRLPAPDDHLYSGAWQRHRPPHLVLVRHYSDGEVTCAIAEQLLLALGSARDPISFEIFGVGRSTCRCAGLRVHLNKELRIPNTSGSANVTSALTCTKCWSPFGRLGSIVTLDRS
jgi:hypothetical protein